MSDLISLDTFTPVVGDQFAVALDGGDTLSATLYEATALPAHAHPNQRRPPFQLKFRAPGPFILTQRIHTLQHHQLGNLEIFLVPLGPDGGDFIYQAVYT